VRPRPNRTLVLTGSLVVTAGCIGDPAPEVAGRAAALTSVTWTDLVGVSASGNDLTKTAPETTFNAGAVSVETLSGDGFVEFTTGESTTDKLAGLSVGNGGQGYQDIDFAIRLNASGRASVYEGGVNLAGIGPYAAGDVFRVQVEAGVVTYWRNGALKYTSAGTPGFPLLVDTSMKTPGATIDDVVVEGVVFWRDVVRAEASGNDLVKTSTLGSWNAGAASIATIPSGDGYVEFTAGEANTAKMAGLSSGNSGQSYTDIDFAISLSDTGGFAVYEGGNSRGNFGLYAAGDTFQVRVTAGVVSYWKNGAMFYTSALSPTYPLLLDTSLRTPGATILDALITTGTPPDCAPLVQTIQGPGPGAALGYPVEAAGDVLLAGRMFDDTQPGVDVYRRGPGSWGFEQTLAADELRYAVATDGVTIALATGTRFDQNRIQIYRHDGVAWVLDGMLDACDVVNSIAVRGDVLLVGQNEPFQDIRPGRVDIYRRMPGGWTWEAALSRPDADPTRAYQFGYPVAIGGDRIFIGARDDDSPQATYAGAVHVYRYNPALPDPGQTPSCTELADARWRHKAVLYDPGSEQGDDFPTALDSNAAGTLLVGANGHEETLAGFTLAAGVWTATRLFGYPPSTGFGRAIALGGADESVLVATGDDGIWLFSLLDGVWGQVAFLDSTGDDVAASGDQMFVGAWSATPAGRVYVRALSPECFGEAQ
jgi:hypothetical protein